MLLPRCPFLLPEMTLDHDESTPHRRGYNVVRVPEDESASYIRVPATGSIPWEAGKTRRVVDGDRLLGLVCISGDGVGTENETTLGHCAAEPRPFTDVTAPEDRRASQPGKRRALGGHLEIAPLHDRVRADI